MHLALILSQKWESRKVGVVVSRINASGWIEIISIFSTSTYHPQLNLRLEINL